MNADIQDLNYNFYQDELTRLQEYLTTIKNPKEYRCDDYTVVISNANQAEAQSAIAYSVLSVK